MTDQPGPEREHLLAMLRGSGGPQPKHPNRRLMLVSAENFRGQNPDVVSGITQRRAALWEELQRLQDRISHLSDDEFSRLALLKVIFEQGEVTVQQCWVSVSTVRGATALEGYNAATSWLASSGCVMKIDEPES